MEIRSTTAIALVQTGDARSAFREQTVTLPELGTHQVLVETEAFGLNYAEVMARRGLYNDAPKLPAVLGYEVVGKIVAVGNQENNAWIGKRVLAFCRFGGYAKHVVTETHAIVELDDYDAGKALALATQYVTAHFMVERMANVQSGERVLVHAAAGGVGTALIQLCKRKGAIVTAKVSSTTKETIAKQNGADFTVNYTASDYTKAIFSTKIDVSFNPVAGKTVKKDLLLLGSGGRLVLFGASELGRARFGIFSKLRFVFSIGFFTPIVLMMRSKSISGVNMLRIADDKPEVLQQCLKEVVELAKSGAIDPQVGKAYAHTELAQAHSDLEGGKTTGKLVVKW